MNINVARYIENETGQEVSVVAEAAAWPPHEQHVVVRYPTGRAYCMTWKTLNLHFTIVTPQEVFINAFGAIDDRPTQKQLELQKEE